MFAKPLQERTRPSVIAVGLALLATVFIVLTPSAPADMDPLTEPASIPQVCQYDANGNITADAGDGFYLGMDGNSVVGIGDIRLVANFAGQPGSRVNAGDTDMNLVLSCNPFNVAFQDANADANLTLGETVYLGVDGDGDSSVDAPSASEWWIRITPGAGHAAGTLVLAGHADLATGGFAAVVGAEFAYVDVDGDVQFDHGESGIITSHAVATGDPTPVGSVYIAPAESFGQQAGSVPPTTGTTGPSPTPTSNGTTTSPPTTTTFPPPPPPPIIDLTNPRTGDVVRHVVSVEGTVQFTEPGDVIVYFYAYNTGSNGSYYWFGESTFVAAPGPWQLDWDTRGLADGTYRLTVYACYASPYWGGCSNTDSATVDVRNVERQADEGIVGCAAHVGPVVLQDLCDGIASFDHPVHPRLQRATFTLSWNGLTSLPIHELRLVVAIGERTFVAEGGSALVLNVTGLGAVEEGLATMDVRIASAGLGPDVALDERFTLVSEWSYR